MGHRLLGWKSQWVPKAGSVLRVTAGGMLAMIVAPFLVGGGNLWPIGIVFDGIIIAAAALLGAAIGAGFRKEAEG